MRKEKEEKMASLDEFNELKKQVVALQKELSRVSDEAEVRKIHHKYGYYLDKCLYNEVNTFFFFLLLLLLLLLRLILLSS